MVYRFKIVLVLASLLQILLCKYSVSYMSSQPGFIPLSECLLNISSGKESVSEEIRISETPKVSKILF